MSEEEEYEIWKAKCPFCKHVFDDAWEWRDDEGQKDCSECEKTFEYSRYTEVSYTTRPIKSKGA